MINSITFSSLGATLACGTGACATVVAAVLEGHADRVSFFFLFQSFFSSGPLCIILMFTLIWTETDMYSWFAWGTTGDRMEGGR